MDSHSTLRDLLELLERDHKFHICIHFFNRSMVSKFQLTRRNVVHDNIYCDKMKNIDPSHSRCLRCRHKAIEKACREKKPYSGLCCFGVFETCYPVFRGDVPLCVIFVGNIVSDQAALLERSGLQGDDPLLDSLQQDMSESLCFQISGVIASYILMRYERMEDMQEKSIHATVAAIRDYVDNFFYQEISLEALAKRYHYNEKYLGTLFKEEIGISFRDYLNDRRLRYAKSRLGDTHANVLDVAIQSGFNNVTYFNRIFKAKYGTTPSKYREKVNQEKKNRQGISK